MMHAPNPYRPGPPWPPSCHDNLGRKPIAGDSNPNPRDLPITLCCLANCQGGTMWFPAEFSSRFAVHPPAWGSHYY